MNATRTTLLMAALMAAGIAAALAQPEPSFEAASIKLHPPPIRVSSDASVRGSRVVAQAVTLRDLITNAYGVRYDQIAGGADWLGSEHYDLEAKAPGGDPLTNQKAMAMLRTLLSDRFKLEVHRETRVMPVYELVTGKNGPKFKPSAPDANGGMVTRGAAGLLHMTATKVTMEDLARQLAGTAGRPVLDKTGLKGDYVFTLDWTPADRAADPDSNTPSMFTAVQEQLGLKLEPAKDPIEMLVIDRAEKPSQN
jgi:uncharacterized protein (TIGR03435 family)